MSAKVQDSDRAKMQDAEDRKAAVLALSADAEEFGFRWLIPRASYRGHQHWTGGLSHEQFIGVDEAEFGAMLREAFAEVREAAYAAGVAAATNNAITAATTCAQSYEEGGYESKATACIVVATTIRARAAQTGGSDE